MKWVYAIAFENEKFLMVYHPKRKGWEMPGGRVEEGESDEAAAVREFREETGQEFLPVSSIEHGQGGIFAGSFKRTGKEGEMEWRLFGSLPEELSFPEVEYIEQVTWARKQIGVASSSAGAQSKS